MKTTFFKCVQNTFLLVGLTGAVNGMTPTTQPATQHVNHEKQAATARAVQNIGLVQTLNNLQAAVVKTDFYTRGEDPKSYSLTAEAFVLEFGQNRSDNEKRRATALYIQAALLGNMGALVYVAYCCEHGMHVPQNKILAAHLYHACRRMAARNGSRGAMDYYEAMVHRLEQETQVCLARL